MKYSKIILLLMLGQLLSAADYQPKLGDYNYNLIKLPLTKDGANALLFVGAINYDITLISFALKQGANINVKIDNKTAIGKILYSLSPFNGIKDYLKIRETLNYLIERGANIDEPSDRGVFDEAPPLMSACEGGFFEIAKFLISKGANVNYVKKNGDTILTSLLELEDVWNTATLYKDRIKLYNDFVSYIIEHSDLNQIMTKELLASGKIETTPLFNMLPKSSYPAMSYNQKNIIELMIQNGADIYAKDSKGKLFIESYSDDIKDFLIKKYELHKYEIEAIKSTKRKKLLDLMQNIMVKDLNEIVANYWV